MPMVTISIDEAYLAWVANAHTTEIKNRDHDWHNTLNIVSQRFDKTYAALKGGKPKSELGETSMSAESRKAVAEAKARLAGREIKAEAEGTPDE